MQYRALAFWRSILVEGESPTESEYQEILAKNMPNTVHGEPMKTLKQNETNARLDTAHMINFAYLIFI